MESLAEIQQLAVRYGLYVDSRNIEALAGLFAPDVRVGDQLGRAAIHDWYDRGLRRFRSSIHFVINHIVDFDDADHAKGIVYCRDELDFPDAGQWQVGTIQYWDTYIRAQGEWCFVRRRFHRWYIGDALTRPAHGLGVDTRSEGRLSVHQLPEEFDTWHAYWAAGSRS
jgi:SnoaL-like domain